MANSDQPQQHSLLEEVNQLQMYPVPNTIVDNHHHHHHHHHPLLRQQFELLPGEGVVHAGHSIHGALALTNYRVYIELAGTAHHVPVGLLEVVEQRDLFFLHIGCKDARTYRLTFANNETCLEWFGRLLKASAPPTHVEETFAFAYFAWSRHLRADGLLQQDGGGGGVFDDEMHRMQFNLHGAWRVTGMNRAYALCASYPPQLLVPAYISDEHLEVVAKFRSSRRIPTAVWRHIGNGAVIARCSQPEVGWLGWRSDEDEQLIDAIACACTQDRGARGGGALYVSDDASASDDDSPQHVTAMVEKKKVLIMDARSYTTAVANRARGGGCECPEYYPSCDIQFMNLANIHSIRKSFHALRQLCTTAAEQANWFSLLEGTRWLQHMSGLMKSAVVLVTAVERDARPVLVHCSDGWDRTPQIVALAELLLDPFYRTVDGFRILVEREWLAFGHKFADRCGHTTGADDPNERCPVFVQWLDCVQQVVRQYPCAFQFTRAYLAKLALHTYSNLYGTFLGNTRQERDRYVDVTCAVWALLARPAFRNHLYDAASAAHVLWPACNVRDLRLWKEVYLAALESPTTAAAAGAVPTTVTPTPTITTPTTTITTTSSAPPSTSPSTTGGAIGPSDPHMTKTRSYGDLLRAADICGGAHARRCSDPNIIVDATTMKMAALSTMSGDDIDCKSDCMYKDDDNNDDDDDDEEEDVDGDVIDAKTETAQRRMRNGDALSSDGTMMMYSVCLDASSSSSPKCALDNGGSVETSTETLVSEMVCSSSNSKKECNGFEALTTPSGEQRECDDCNGRQMAPWSAYSALLPGNEWRRRRVKDNNSALDDDGLVPLTSDVQERLQQIIDAHKHKVDALQRELQWYRTEYRNKVCRKCNQTAAAEGGGGGSGTINDETNSVVESVCSAGEGRAASTVESLRSDRSWEALEEEAAAAGGGGGAHQLDVDASSLPPPTLWFPDHAVHNCMGCGTMFWLGRRKHHCRNCGRIFCSDCSENSAPLPSEQLYVPVRVCVSCFAKLNSERTTMPEDGGGAAVDALVRNAIVVRNAACCKTHAGRCTATNPRQIAASSN